ncbi:hypothetical protein RRG08_045448 [Elysia crispata]|uniref:Uncharacterized protein n=1 Tax=Elysia crispata TaxID=231223 RepID=A0AAE1AWS6_9GAST|nr:hypothetical protein RRG08_045448 [Elysia crispata]
MFISQYQISEQNNGTFFLSMFDILYLLPAMRWLGCAKYSVYPVAVARTCKGLVLNTEKYSVNPVAVARTCPPNLYESLAWGQGLPHFDVSEVIGKTYCTSSEPGAPVKVPLSIECLSTRNPRNSPVTRLKGRAWAGQARPSFNLLRGNVAG